jgi:hypothetical protein
VTARAPPAFSQIVMKVARNLAVRDGIKIPQRQEVSLSGKETTIVAVFLLISRKG